MLIRSGIRYRFFLAFQRHERMSGSRPLIHSHGHNSAKRCQPAFASYAAAKGWCGHNSTLSGTSKWSDILNPKNLCYLRFLCGSRFYGFDFVLVRNLVFVAQRNSIRDGLGRGFSPLFTRLVAVARIEALFEIGSAVAVFPLRPSRPLR